MIFLLFFIFPKIGTAQDGCSPDDANGSTVCFNDRAPQCRYWTASGWDAFINSQLLVSMSSSQDPNSKQYFYSPKGAINYLKENCESEINKPEIKPCLDRIFGYFSQFNPDQEDAYTGRMSNAEYLASQPKDAMELPVELRNSNLPKNWRDIAKKNGWKYVLFHSNTGYSGRLVFFVPGKTYDRYILYAGMGNPPSSDPTKYDYLQMQAVQKVTDAKDERPKYYFKSWDFEGTDKVPTPLNRGGKCVTCHISGPRAIYPVDPSAFPMELGGVSDLDEFNDLIVHKGPLDYSPYYDSKYFPSQIKVGGPRCEGCHDGEYRQSLVYSLENDGLYNSDNAHRKMFDEESMPPVEHAFEDRHRLFDSIKADFNSKLKGWLTETKCTSLIRKPSKPNPLPLSPPIVQ